MAIRFRLSTLQKEALAEFCSTFILVVRKSKICVHQILRQTKLRCDCWEIYSLSIHSEGLKLRFCQDFSILAKYPLSTKLQKIQVIVVLESNLPRAWRPHYVRVSLSKRGYLRGNWFEISSFSLPDELDCFFSCFLQIFGVGSVAQMVLSEWKFGNFFSVNFSWGIGVTLGCYWAGGISGESSQPTRL